jgi:serine-type D-Ala-D-Ala carboxypeptidase (penicillin-binding protein 5/6)
MSKRIAAIAGLLVALAATAGVAIAIWPDRTADRGTETVAASGARSATAAGGAAQADGIPGNAPPARTPEEVVPPKEAPGIIPATDSRFALGPAPVPLPVTPRLKRPPAAGILFDVDSGEVLWQRRPRERRPMASLTKMMTALLIAEWDPAADRVMISAKAAHTPGSATGLLPAGRAVPLEPLLEALIMISANDAAVALAEHDSGTTARFVKWMNERAVSMGLTCTHFSTPNGLKDGDNHSCAMDLAALARADLANPRIAQIARTRYAKPRFPIKGHRLHLANNHYFLGHGLGGIPGARVTGLKTGWTDGAGRCYVTTAKLGGHHLGVVVLDSPDPIHQVPALLRAGFVEVGAAPPQVGRTGSPPIP